MDIAAVCDYLTALQERLTAAAVAASQTVASPQEVAPSQVVAVAPSQDVAPPQAAAFSVDEWTSPLGRGRRMFMQDGDVFERAGINFSDISGARLPAAATARRDIPEGCPYRAGGVSAVFHPRNPYCPTAHMNVRWFAAGEVWWFGGGMDLTPYYGFVEDCRHFHRQCRAALDAHDKALYPRFKKSCDEYFFIRHRNEARGVGGVFFDDFSEGGFAHAFAVLRAVGDAFLPAYFPLVEKRQQTPYGKRQRRWQQQRRGRYVEFNLLYDRGTLFGLQSGGRPEAILMSLPPSVRWSEAPPQTEEATLLSDFLPPRNWTD